MLGELNVCFVPSIFKWRAYLIVVHRRDAYEDKKKAMSDVKYIYLFFKVNKCSDLVAYGKNRIRSELAVCPVSQSVNLFPVSVEGLRSDKLNFRSQKFDLKNEYFNKIYLKGTRLLYTLAYYLNL